MNKVKKGNRNNTLFGVAIRKVLLGERNGMKLREILYEYNEKNCDPPLEKYEIKEMVGDVLHEFRRQEESPNKMSGKPI